MWRKFMLPIHKQKRIERLLRWRVCDADGDATDTVRPDRGAGAEADRSPASANGEAAERTLVRSVLNTLELDALKMLCEVIESRGDALGSCVTVPKNEYVLRSKSATPVVLFCRYFRWPEVDCQSRLRRLFVCHGASGDCHDCINPYHWSRVYSQVPESSPPPVSGTKLSSLPAERCLSGESETVVPESLTTGGTYSSCDDSQRTWCRLLYRERKRRVGPDWHARGPVQNVFYNLPHEDGVALSDVCGQHPNPEPDVRKTRPQIGAGLSLSLEPSGVWLYNRSQKPLFVSSPTLDPPEGSPASEAVHKLPPGYSVLVFSWTEYQARRRSGDAHHELRDPRTAVVSFAKGWGAAYKRRTLLECPCHLELCFTLPIDGWR
ncbi:mothers against decapentaplegic homolog 6-like [Amphibalanus amphitrite]|uniref:mothers against decapentaplegic homolog 6-like n=1 Tax=Amphibalanus amphitrite TaxID=1232801 RepID=UPI001C8FD6E6|nr:mothers against decapentaplegic homolog 6-like [Amphibalanus amphitrite]